MQFDDLLLQLLSSEAQEEEPLDRVLLLQLVDLAEHCPPASDVQPLKYVLAWRPAQVEMVSRHLRHGTSKLRIWGLSGTRCGVYATRRRSSGRAARRSRLSFLCPPFVFV